MDEKGLAEGLPFRKPGDVKGVIKEQTFHKPLRQRAVCAERSAIGEANALPLGRARGAPCKTAPRSANGEAIACHSRRSRGVAAPAKGTPLAWPLACAQQFCSARPVRAPKEEQCCA